MIDLKEFALVTRKDDSVVMIECLACEDLHGVVNLQDAMTWAGEHACT